MLFRSWSLLIVALDRGTKIWVETEFARGERLPITDFFNLVLVYNRGAAFSFLADAGGWQRYVLVTVSVVAVFVIVWLLVRQPGETAWRASLASILGGAIGNLWDRVTVGEVVDFLDFHVAGYHWPAFNVADSAISIGAVVLLLDGLLGAKANGSHVSR